MRRLIAFHLFLLLATSCAHNSSETWENMKTAGRYMQRGVNSVFGKEYESRMVSSDSQFYGPFDEDFIPLADADLKNQFSDTALPQPRAIPGQFGLPGLDSFYAPPDALRGVFSAIHFNTDEHTIRDAGEVALLTKMADYLKKHPNFYVVIIGHCDERASASYNMALGMRRANAVRSFLVKQGADLNRVYTLSRGKEQPISLGHTKDDWKINRRAEFKVYEK